jgi:hypothetical protein
VIGQLAASPESAFFAASAVLLLAAAVLAVVFKPVIALWALTILFAAESATPVPLDTSALMAGGTHLYPADVLSVVMLAATVIQVVRRPPPARIMLPLSAAGAVFAVNLYLGFAQFGLRHATNESREWFYLLVTTAFVITAGPWSPRFWRPLFALAAGLVALAWLGLARYGLHPAGSQITVGGQLVDSRPLTAAGALALAWALIVILGSRDISTRRKLIFGGVIAGTLVLVQQRTVWAVLGVVFLLWAATSWHRHRPVQHRRLAAAGVAALCAAAVVLASGVATGSALSSSLAEATASHSTFRYRVIGWAELLHSDHSVGAIVFGQSFGTGYHRSIFGVATDVAPHSFYVATLLRLGLIGVLALTFLYWNIWKHRRQAAAALGVSPLTVALLLVALLVFSITYEPSTLAGALAAGLLVWEPRATRQSAIEAATDPALLLQGVP